MYPFICWCSSLYLFFIYINDIVLWNSSFCFSLFYTLNYVLISILDAFCTCKPLLLTAKFMLCGIHCLWLLFPHNDGQLDCSQLPVTTNSFVVNNLVYHPYGLKSGIAGFVYICLSNAKLLSAMAVPVCTLPAVCECLVSLHSLPTLGNLLLSKFYQCVECGMTYTILIKKQCWSSKYLAQAKNVAYFKSLNIILNKM